MENRLNAANGTANLENLGFKDKDTALLLDLIVYLALENVAFYRTLDLNTCDALLSWVDYEYLGENGSYQYKYRERVSGHCEQLETLLKAWSSGLDRVLLFCQQTFFLNQVYLPFVTFFLNFPPLQPWSRVRPSAFQEPPFQMGILNGSDSFSTHSSPFFR